MLREAVGTREGSLYSLLNFAINLKPYRENVFFKVYIWGDITSEG